MAARSGVVADYQAKQLRKMFPIYHCIWLYNTKLWTKALAFFKTEEGTSFIEVFKKSCKDNECSLENLRAYVEACSQFRVYCEEYLGDANEAYSTPISSIDSTVAVNRSILAGLCDMLVMIVTKRNAMLGTNTQKTAAGEPGHYQDFVDFLERG